MNYVLDASALLAFFQGEPGSETVENALESASISAVNWAEVVQKAVANGVEVTGMREELEALGVLIVPFDQGQAEATGLLWSKKRRYGLSLGDRACLCLGREHKATIFTADRAWEKLDLGVKIHVIR
ncbi:MAG: type II toxin-antitoxin system VapC family toxin [Nitrospinae bacterium]|nr:type II toxin-antitoxin system VapC family toxin [Nitrospinota bacterium]